MQAGTKLITALSLACAFSSIPEDSWGLNTVQHPSWRSPGTGNAPIPWCWEPGQNPDAINFSDIQGWTDDLLRRWQRASGIRIVARGNCPTTGSEKMIRIRIRGHLQTDSRPGGATKFGGTASLMSPAVGDNTMSIAIDVATRLNSTSGLVERHSPDDLVRWVIIHEFGHVLNFHDEHATSMDPHAVGCRRRSGNAPVFPTTEVTRYDAGSVMNYCSGFPDVLSPLDIQGMRKTFGWRDATDYDNDGMSNLTVFRAGRWYIDRGAWDVKYGEPGDVPIAADFDGDGKSDIAVWRPSNGWWYVRNSSAPELRVQWGNQGDIPATADLDGNGRVELVVYRPSTRTFYIRELDGATRSYGPWGEAGDIPVIADYDGDGISDLALFRPAGAHAGTWFVLDSTTPGKYRQVKFGEAGDTPLVGDFDGDLKSDFTVWRPSTRTFYVNGAAGMVVAPWGTDGDIPVSVDFDGNGIDELGVWRPSTGEWFLRTLSAHLITVPHGAAGDIPLGRTIMR